MVLILGGCGPVSAPEALWLRENKRNADIPAMQGLEARTPAGSSLRARNRIAKNDKGTIRACPPISEQA